MPADPLMDRRMGTCAWCCLPESTVGKWPVITSDSKGIYIRTEWAIGGSDNKTTLKQFRALFILTLCALSTFAFLCDCTRITDYYRPTAYKMPLACKPLAGLTHFLLYTATENVRTGLHTLAGVCRPIIFE